MRLASLALLCAASLALASPREQRGLAPVHDGRYLVVDEQFASLDRVHKHRIPTLRRIDARAGGPRMVVAVYQIGEDGSETALGSEEGEDVRVERIVDVDGDGHLELVLRAGNGGDCVGCTWLAIHGARAGKLTPLAPEHTIHELSDVDGDGKLEGLSFRTELTGFAGLPHDHTPRVEEVWSLLRGTFREDDARYARYHWRQLMEHRRALERPGARSGLTEVSLACALYFEHEVLGKAPDGFAIASRFLKRLAGSGDRETRFAAERAQKALEERSGQPPAPPAPRPERPRRRR